MSPLHSKGQFILFNGMRAYGMGYGYDYTAIRLKPRPIDHKNVQFPSSIVQSFHILKYFPTVKLLCLKLGKITI